MRTQLSFLAGALAVGGFWAIPVDAQPAPADQSMTQRDTSGAGSTTQPSGQAVNDKDARAIRAILSMTIQAEATRDPISNLNPLLSKASQDQLTNSTKQNSDDLNTAIDQFRKDWRDRYNSDFNINGQDPAAVLDFDHFKIMQGEVLGESARTAGETMTPAATQPSSEAERIGQRTGAVNKEPGGETNNMNSQPPGQPAKEIEKATGSDTNVAARATVYMAGMDGRPSHTLHLSYEGAVIASWKLDLPQSVDAQKLHDNLLEKVNRLDQMKDRWPADQAAAYRMAAHHLLSVFSETEGATDNGNPNPAQ